MRRFLSLLVAAALAALPPASPAHAWIGKSSGGIVATPTAQLFFMASNTAVSTTLTRWIPFGMAYNSNNTELTTFRFPISGTLTELSFAATTTQTTGSYAGTVRVNAADSAATCSGATTTACTWTGSVSVAAGDTAGFKIVPSTSPAPSTATNVVAVAKFVPSTAGETVIAFGTPSNNFPNNATQYILPQSGSNPNTIANRQTVHVPIAGTIDKLCSTFASAPGTGTSWAVTLAKAGVDQTLTTAIADSSTAACDTNAAHAVTVAGPSGVSTPGDDIELGAAPTATPTAAKYAGGVRFVPTGCSGCFPIFSAPGAAGTGGTTTTLYYGLTSGASAGTSTRADAESISRAMTIDSATCRSSVAAGASKSYTCNLKVNNTTQLTCTITGTSQTACNVAGTVAVANLDKVVWEVVPTNTPAGSSFSGSVLAH